MEQGQSSHQRQESQSLAIENELLPVAHNNRGDVFQGPPVMSLALAPHEASSVAEDDVTAATATATTAVAAAAGDDPPNNMDMESSSSPNNNEDDRQSPMMAMLYRMEQKIESIQTRMGMENQPGRSDSNSNSDDGGASTASIHPSGTSAVAAVAAARKHKRDNHCTAIAPQNEQNPTNNINSNSNSRPTTNININNSNNNNSSNHSKATRINWAKSPHRERLAAILDEWFSKTGRAIDESTGEPIANYKVYAEKVGISRTTLFKYIHTDPSKRRLVKGEGESAGRGKKRLIDEDGLKFIVKELKAKAHVGRDGFSRKEATDLIMEKFNLSRRTASLQFKRHILPEMMKDGLTLTGEEARQGDSDNGDWPGQQSTAGAEQQLVQPPQHPQQQPRRSIVISGVTSGLGQALFKYYLAHGHDVAGCGQSAIEIQSLQMEHPGSKLSVVDISDDQAVAKWAQDLEDNGMKRMDLVIASAEVFPEKKLSSPMWEVPQDAFDNTIDVNVKGVSNVLRHFIPRMIQSCSHAASDGRLQRRGVFVAMSSGLGRSPDPHCAAYCASKFAIEGLMKSVAMSLPDPLCAVPLAPGIVDTTSSGGKMQHEHSTTNNSKQSNRGVEVNRWVNVAAPMILRMNRKDNGKSMSVKGLYSVRDRQSWIIQDGSGVP